MLINQSAGKCIENPTVIPITSLPGKDVASVAPSVVPSVPFPVTSVTSGTVSSPAVSIVWPKPDPESDWVISCSASTVVTATSPTDILSSALSLALTVSTTAS